MRSPKLAHIESIFVQEENLQAFFFFLGRIWEEVEIDRIQRAGDHCVKICLALPDDTDSELIHHLWEDWSSRRLASAYAVLN